LAPEEVRGFGYVQRVPVNCKGQALYAALLRYISIPQHGLAASLT